MYLDEIMDTQATTLSEQTPLEEIVGIVQKAKTCDFPVVDANYNFRGMLYERDLLKVFYEGITPEKQGSLKEISDLRNLSTEMHKITAGQIMTSPVKTFSSEELIVRAGAMILFENLKIVPVVQGTRLVGMITPARIFSEINRQFEVQWSRKEGSEEKQISGADKRFFERIAFKVPMAYKVFKTAEGVATVGSGKIGSTVDASAGGLMGLVQENIPLNTELQVALDLYRNDEPVRMLCRVVRCLPAKEPGFYNLGLMFLSISPEERRRMNKYLERISGGQKSGPETKS